MGIIRLIFLLFSSTCASYSLAANTDTQKTDINILFIGNSLTYTNNLPELVKKRALQKDLIVTNSMVAFPNYAMIDHLDDGKIQKLIAHGNFDFVIMQQGPSSQEEGRLMLLED